MSASSLNEILIQSFDKLSESGIQKSYFDNALIPEFTSNLASNYEQDAVAKSNIPFIAIMDPEETETYREGVYIAIFFNQTETVQTVTLTLIQGVANIPHTNREQVLSNQAAKIREKIDPRDFRIDSPTFANASSGYQKYYDNATIVYKQYTLEELSEEQDIESDIATLESIYQQYVDRESGEKNSSSADLLHIGRNYISRHNFTVKRRQEYTKAVDQAITIAIERDVDAVIHTGGVFATRQPQSDCEDRLRKSLQRLADSDISCYHVPDERDKDMDEVTTLYERNLLTELDSSPAIVGNTAFVGKHPEQTYSELIDGITVPEGVDNTIVAGFQPIEPPVSKNDSQNLEAIQSQRVSEIDAILVGNSNKTDRYRDDIDIHAVGPTEPHLTKSLMFSDEQPDPYPRSVAHIQIEGTDISRSVVELPHRPYFRIELRADKNASVDAIVEELTELDISEAAVVVRVWNNSQGKEFAKKIENQLESEIFAVRVYSELSDDVPQDGFEYDVAQKILPENSDSSKVHIYSANDINNESYTQEAFSRQLLGERSTDRDVGQGEQVILYDDGPHSKSDKQAYGPLIADSTVDENLEPEAWHGEFPQQVNFKWSQVYRVDPDKLDVNLGDHEVLNGIEAANTIVQLKQKGNKIQVTDDGGFIDPEEEDTDDTRKEVGEEENEKEGEEEAEGATVMITQRNSDTPTNLGTALDQARQPGVALLQAAIDRELQPDRYRQALCHLVAGKNVIFYGPPGSGKTRMAKRLSHVMCTETIIETANAEWTYQKVVGGLQPVGDKFVPQPGVLTEAADKCTQSLSKHGHPSWLVIDELNRANLDEAFGEVFTLLDIDHRKDSKLSYGNEHVHGDDATQELPVAFRILGTMNTEDQAQLFALGYAFRRRFSFVKVPPIQMSTETPSSSEHTVSEVDISKQSKRAQRVIRDAVDSYFTGASPEADSKYGLPKLGSIVFTDGDSFESALATVEPDASTLNFDTAILSFVETVHEENIATIGQGIVIDAIKYVVTAHELFPEVTDWNTVDEAVMAYILPQLESYMTELRKADTIASDSNQDTSFDDLIDHAGDLGLLQTVDQLVRAKETHQILQ